jgi:hypothetical protein
MNEMEKLEDGLDEMYDNITITIHLHIESSLSEELSKSLEEDMMGDMYDLQGGITAFLDNRNNIHEDK